MASRNASFHDGVVAGALLAPLKFVFALSLAFVGILLAAWTVDWIFVFKVWPDGIERLRSILAVDLARGIDLATRQGGVPGAITGTANLLYAVVFRATGIYDMGLRFSEGVALSIPDTIVRTSYIANRDAIEVAMIGTQLLGVRLATLALMLPLLLLIYLIAAADGLTQRAIRRASGGRESASLYHRAKHLQVAGAVTTVLTVLVWPLPVDWLLVGLPCAIAVGILVRMQWAYYKKHL
jgi:integrating conjugative element membrane protein (TIGR03747 family)